LQYLVMPLAAWAVASLMKLPPALLAGMVRPGGTASNVICYLARGNVALSVSLTFLSTLLAFLLTPAFTWLLAGRAVPVPFEDMLLDILRIVLAPVLIGAALNSLFGRRLSRLMPVFPVLSVIAIVIIIAIIVALNPSRLGHIGLAVSGAIVAHNGIGLLLGYLLPRLAGHDTVTARTLAIETGMQNSGLAVALALKYFGAAAALPGALFSIWHNLSGAVLAKAAGHGRAVGRGVSVFRRNRAGVSASSGFRSTFEDESPFRQGQAEATGQHAVDLVHIVGMGREHRAGWIDVT